MSPLSPMPADSEPASVDRPVKLVVVTGSGRSGTSTVAGALKMLGSYVPQPEIPPNDANPRGYFEPTWVVVFDKKVLAEAGVKTLDGRPAAVELMSGATGREDLLAELSEWFSGQLQGHQVVVKDPRIVWLRDMYEQVARDLGVETAWLTMLRHPAEVVGSRDRHYLANADESRRVTRETANLAGWVNVGLVNERASRGGQRAFVHYSSLIEDWRAAMADVARRLDLSYDYDLASAEHHPVDDFIDVTLRRVQVTLDDLDVPANLREIAEHVWNSLDALSRDPEDPAAMATLDRMREEYDRLFAHSAALVQDATDSAVEETRRKVRKQVTRKLTKAAEASTADGTDGGDGGDGRSTLRRAAGRVRRVLRERRA
jgi:hypothetical protein